MREASANWIHGFSYNLGSCNVVEVEIRGILQALRLAWSLGFMRLLVAAYSLLVVKWLQGAYESCIRVHNLFVAIKELLAREWEVKLEHVYREQNRAIDYLTSIS